MIGYLMAVPLAHYVHGASLSRVLQQVRVHMAYVKSTLTGSYSSGENVVAK
jgi:hypothetical protein